MSYSEDEELERIKREKIRRWLSQQETQRKLQEQLREMEEAAEAEAVKKMIFLRFVDKDVRDRISNIRLANPELANKIEAYILTLLQSGKVNKINFEVFKKIVLALKGKK